MTTDGTTVRWPDISGFVYTTAIGLGCVSLTHSETDASGVGYDNEIPNLALLVTLVDQLRNSPSST